MRYIYSLFTFFFYPILLLIIFFRRFIDKEDRKRYKEKILLSSVSSERNYKKKLLWFHAASLGEVQSIFPIVNFLNKNDSNLEFLITTITLSSGKLVEKEFCDKKNIHHKYLPIDVKFLVKKFIDIWKPNLVMFVDSEIWPNLIFEIKKKNISTAIINGRMTKKSFDRWMLIPRFAKEIFANFDLCLASSEESKRFFKLLNTKNVKYLGNIKLAKNINKDSKDEKNLDILNDKTVWSAVSTHDGEELFCLKAHLKLKNNIKNLITIIIPRHINRCHKIEKICNKLELNSQILNENERIDNKKEIIIINSFGSLSKYLQHSKCVFIGKSIPERFRSEGGQSPVEAIKLNCKVFHGPHISNFKEIYKLLHSLQVSEEIKNEDELTNRLNRDLILSNEKTNNISSKINLLGKKILDDNITEINKILN